ncbi:TRAP transporter small permease [Roseateles sp. DAIF2]|uniref:TRAP transporter small permease n=1 Tax=Roseateles sp. DAIF2 TaxID=2714952 RepID=UPI0018A27716|nr:TRAP transporter small permease [Roseateles sp. DAIF2]QPF72918.1 TRAP transporter small permease [Roseateles sp. DAIF2]
MSGLLRRLALISALAGCACACLVALLTVASIAGRSLWSRPIPGDVELSQFGIALCIALCLPWCQLQRANIIVDFFTQKMAPRPRGLLDAVGALLLALMVGLLAWRTMVGALSVREAGEATMILDLPMWISYAALGPGLALTALIALAQVLPHLRGEPAA